MKNGSALIPVVRQGVGYTLYRAPVICGDEMKSRKVSFAIPILFSLVYVAYFYVVLNFFISNNLFISTNSVSINNLAARVLFDFCTMLLLPLILLMIYRKRLADFNLTLNHSYLLYILLIIMVLLFYLHKDFTVIGIYKLFFYLVVIGFSEEFIFRGYVYNKLRSHNRLLAIIISGFFWGIMHAILPGLLAGASIGQIGIRMIYEIGGGILCGYFFIYLQERSKSLLVPVFVHAILDYSVGYIGVITAIGAFIYLFADNRKKIHKPV